MKKQTSFAFLALLVLLTSACDWKGIRGNGQIKTETRTVTAFTRLDAGGFYKIVWQPGAPACRITTDENLLSHIKTSMEGDLLKVEMENSLAPTEGIKVEISSPSLAGAALSGALNFEATQISGSTFALETSGASKVTLAGKVNRLLASLTGASKLQANDLAAEDVELSVTGAGKAEVSATNLLRAAITGAGKVSYSGHPKSVVKKITGAGKIQPRD